jgi:hypothetical protein
LFSFQDHQSLVSRPPLPEGAVAVCDSVNHRPVGNPKRKV